MYIHQKLWLWGYPIWHPGSWTEIAKRLNAIIAQVLPFLIAPFKIARLNGYLDHRFTFHLPIVPATPCPDCVDRSRYLLERHLAMDNPTCLLWNLIARCSLGLSLTHRQGKKFHLGLGLSNNLPKLTRFTELGDSRIHQWDLASV